MKIQCTGCRKDLTINEADGQAYQMDGHGKIYCETCEVPHVKLKQVPQEFKAESVTPEPTKMPFWKRLFN